jgi:hypothetical protein
MNVRDEGIINRMVKHKVHVTWPVAMSIEGSKKLSYRAITWNWIWDPDNGFEPENSRPCRS